jgi:RNA polymerase sigma-70 factor (ECF subfamily)
MRVDDFAATLDAARAGDEKAFSSLFRAYNSMLLRYLRVIAGGEAAEDLSSDTWLDVVRGLGRFDGDEAGFRGWLFTIARRRHLDWRRRQGRRPVTVGDDALDHIATGIDPAAMFDDVAGTEAALQLVATLPAEQAEVVALRAIAGLDVAEVAMIVGKTSGAVRVLAHRGLHRLAGNLGANVPPLEV